VSTTFLDMSAFFI